MLTILGFLIFPILWSVPEALITAELATAFPENRWGIRARVSRISKVTQGTTIAPKVVLCGKHPVPVRWGTPHGRFAAYQHA